MPFSSPSGRYRRLIIPEEYEKWNRSVYAVSADTAEEITGTVFYPTLDDEIENIVEVGIARCGGREGCIALKPSQNLLRLFLIVD